MTRPHAMPFKQWSDEFQEGIFQELGGRALKISEAKLRTIYNKPSLHQDCDPQTAGMALAFSDLFQEERESAHEQEKIDRAVDEFGPEILEEIE